MKNLLFIVSFTLAFSAGCRSTSSIKAYEKDSDCVANNSNTRVACLSEKSDSIYLKLNVFDIKTEEVVHARNIRVEKVEWRNDSILRIYQVPEMVEKNATPVIDVNINTGKIVKETENIR